jgi:hypothetical protein
MNGQLDFHLRNISALAVGGSAALEWKSIIGAPA